MPAQEGIGLEGPGIVIFGAAIAALVLLDIGYMRGRWGFVLDAPAAYLILGLPVFVLGIWLLSKRTSSDPGDV